MGKELGNLFIAQSYMFIFLITGGGGGMAFCLISATDSGGDKNDKNVLLIGAFFLASGITTSFMLN